MYKILDHPVYQAVNSHLYDTLTSHISINPFYTSPKSNVGLKIFGILEDAITNGLDPEY